MMGNRNLVLFVMQQHMCPTRRCGGAGKMSEGGCGDIPAPISRRRSRELLNCIPPVSTSERAMRCALPINSGFHLAHLVRVVGSGMYHKSEALELK